MYIYGLLQCVFSTSSLIFPTHKNATILILGKLPYLIGEVGKGGLLMISSEWMMHVMGGIGCCWWGVYFNTGEDFFK
jgi:hypothetical protein